MRVIAGRYKGMKLHFGAQKELRPTQDRVKEAVFNIIGKKICEATVLDAFAGTGAIGMEALSRGAKHVTFIEPRAIYIKKNLEKIEGSHDIYTIVKGRFSRCISTFTDSFDLIYLDPPWNRFDLFAITLKQILELDIIKPDGWIILELPNKQIDALNVSDLGYTIVSKRTYGNTMIMFIKKTE